MPVERSKSDQTRREPGVQVQSAKFKMNSRFFAASIKVPIEDNRMNENAPLKTLDVNVLHYPITSAEREKYTTSTGKKLTAYQWAVYDFLMTIPKGKVATYKDVATVAGGSPRSAGSALRNNPFSPYVPCHRIIASNLFVGGFFGEWGKEHKSGKLYNEKVEILQAEGVEFDSSGRLLLPEECLWKQ